LLAPSETGVYYTVSSVAEPPTLFAATQHTQKQVGDFVHQQSGFGDGSLLDLGTLALPKGTCGPLGGVRNGTTLCLPPPASAPQATPVYTDAACTQRAFSVPVPSRLPPPPPAAEFVVESPSLCGTEFTVFNNTGTVVKYGGTFYRKVAGTCARDTVALTQAIITGSPSSDYPMGTVSPDAPSGRLGYLLWTGPDGMSIPVASWDHKLGRECFAQVASDGVFRCLPYVLSPRGSLFLTSAHITSSCEDPGAEVTGACDGVPPVTNRRGAYGLRPTGPSCDMLGGVGLDVVWLGSPLTAYYQSETACIPYPETAYGYPGETAILDPALFAALQEMIE